MSSKFEIFMLGLISGLEVPDPESNAKICIREQRLCVKMMRDNDIVYKPTNRLPFDYLIKLAEKMSDAQIAEIKQQLDDASVVLLQESTGLTLAA